MEQPLNYGKKFIEGKGWEVTEAGQSQVTPVHQRPAVKTSAPAMTREDVERLAPNFGLVAVDADEYRELLERNRELENLLDRAGEAVGAVKAAEKTTPAKKTKKGAEPPIQEQIAAATSLEELSALMMDVEDPALLALADAKAEQIQGGNP